MFKKSILTVLLIVIGLCTAGSAYGAPSGLLAHWPLDEGEGTVAADISGNGLDGTLEGDATWITDGVIDGALHLVRAGDREGGQVRCPYIDLNNRDFSVALWCNPSDLSVTRPSVFGQYGDGHVQPGGNFSIRGTGNGTVQIEYYGSAVNSEPGMFVVGEWVHVTAVADVTNSTRTLYVNGVEAASDGNPAYLGTDGEIFIGSRVGFKDHWPGDVDDVRVYDHAVTADKILTEIMLGITTGSGLAYKPIPADGESEVQRDGVVLSWKAGAYAPAVNGHNVYFSDSFDDVNDGIGGVTQDANSYDPGRLEFGTTYFWRVDEVNAPPDSTVFPGNIWSFTTEPLARPIPGQAISATASSQAAGQGPEKTIDGSGLVDELHLTETTDMWATVEGEALPAWIQYEFDIPYKLHEMLVWNYNGTSFLNGLGLKDITVEYSTDGVNWILNNSVSVFNRAPGADDYAANTTVPFGDVPVKYVKITATTNWLDNLLAQYGLSEVRFMQIPVNARKPDPDDGATEVAIDVILGWRDGREAAEHNVYISADEQAVIGGTVAAVTVGEASYGPLSLDLASTYYWRVDEVNNANTVPIWEGGTWSFTTGEYLVVDDFESYNDIDAGEEGSNLIYATWIDGYDNPSINGSTVGYIEAFQPTMETDIVHGGRQSVPVSYDNTSASISEVTVSSNDLAVGSDWTINTPDMLTLWFYGDPNNAVTEQMYVELNGVKKIYDGEAGDIATSSWTRWDIELASFGINLGNVTSLTIGFERTGATGGSGMLFIDDVWLYRPAPVRP